MQKKITDHNIQVEIESAGTSASHRGASPDSRSQREGVAAGYVFSGIVSRPVQDTDFEYYDVILAMDNDNLKALSARCPAELQHKIKLFLQYDPEFPAISEVPDPYYGGSRGFALVLKLIEQGCDGLLQQLKQRNIFY